ncbi:hypothetical protein [Nocardioides speluncae]|uniref:hypothetical protein n=1 Tax=Nocardioides speluncae TaxID=2670337 RepID=UPI000D68EF36|nr:hypothetical protein [Nocardioides speluncae]
MSRWSGGWVAALVAALLLVSLAACGEDEPEPTTQPRPTPTPTTPVADPLAAPCVVVDLRAMTSIIGEPVSDPEPLVGGGSEGEAEWQYHGCVLDTGRKAEGRLSVGFLVDEDDEPMPTRLLDELEAAYKTAVPKELEYEPVGGIGDGAFFANATFNERLFVRHGSIPFVITGEDSDHDQFTREQLKQIAIAVTGRIAR